MWGEFSCGANQLDKLLRCLDNNHWPNGRTHHRHSQLGVLDSLFQPSSSRWSHWQRTSLEHISKAGGKMT